MERRFGGSRFGGRGFRDDRRGGGFRPRDSGGFEKPVKIGETYDVEIAEVGAKGDGIARVKNFVIFVANTEKGEKCKIKITSVSNRFAVGEKVEGEAAEEAVEEEEAEEEEETSEEEETADEESEEDEEK